ncbi:hypothetical protein NQZ68_016652 [Dissostichus eleginoides]|nr:hypothetical protein NQZ68_016652 [Dissostichus eleginoides]
MMDDTLRPKHHINPLAQCDSPKDAAAVSPPPQAQGKRWADCEEEEDTPVMKSGEPDWLEMERTEDKKGKETIGARRAREEGISESQEVWRAEREDRLAKGSLENEYREREGFTESATRGDRLMAILQTL